MKIKEKILVKYYLTFFNLFEFNYLFQRLLKIKKHIIFNFFWFFFFFVLKLNIALKIINNIFFFFIFVFFFFKWIKISKTKTKKKHLPHQECSINIRLPEKLQIVIAIDKIFNFSFSCSWKSNQEGCSQCRYRWGLCLWWFRNNWRGIA
jgi:hypothetical protein